MSDSEISLEGKKNVDGRFEKEQLTYNYALDSTNMNGAPISHSDAETMIKNWWSENGVGTEDDLSNVDPINIAAAFDKQLLLLLLSQRECEGLRFYFCTRPDNKRQSLVVVGMDKEGNDLGQPMGMSERVPSIFGRSEGAAEDLAGPTIIAEVGSETKRP